MTLRRPLSGKRHATVVSAYAFTMTYPWCLKQVIWWSWFCDICNIPDRQFHPAWGLQCQSGQRPSNLWRSNWTEGIGKQWHPTFKEVCRAWTTDHQHSLPSTNSQQGSSKHWHLIDYVIVRRKERQDVRMTKTMCGSDCWTDHSLIGQITG